MPTRRFWQQAANLERLSQLRHDALDVFGSLITLAYANKDDVYARTLEVQHNAVMSYLDRQINAVASGAASGNRADAVSLGGQIDLLRAALLSAYDRDSLRMMMRMQLNEDLDTVAGDANLNVVVFNLIEWARRTGNWDRLLDGALAANPGNKALVDTVAGIRQSG